ncbi:MAG TPA: DegQ family serine endoprotease [Stellaceae bacterium]|nr:DegQ family serine endoprotease [Stellaceae bacterium]
MRGMRLVVLLLLLVFVAPAFAETRQPPASREAIHLSFAPVVKKAAPAVVNVYSRRTIRTESPFANDPFFRRFFGENSPFVGTRERVQNSLGSGVIVDPAGLIVTNQHVIQDADEIRVVLSDRREFEAKVVLSDEHSDLAVLKIDAHGAPLPTVEIGDSDALEVGDLVLAIGDPFGVGQTVTSGIVSALARSIGASDFRSFIQTDAPINPGNSGGALVDLDGKLVGINSEIYSRSGGSMGLGFAIPTAMVRMVLQAARNGGKIARPWLGATGQQVTQELADSLKLARPAGVLLNEIVPDSPAAKAGLHMGDVVLALDGHPVDDPDVLKFRIATAPLDHAMTLDYWRNGADRTGSVTLERLPEQPPRAEQVIDGPNPLAGATVGNLNPAYDDELGLDPAQRGVVISQVATGSRAQRLGLQPGDILASLNREPIDAVTQLEDMLTASESPWTIAIRREGKLLTVTVR